MIKLERGMGKSTLPYSETYIFEMTDILLRTGFHTIQVDTLDQGRTMMYTFLDALSCYYSIAACAKSDTPLRSSVIDLYAALNATQDDVNGVCDYFLHQFYGDFIWIEASKALTDTVLFRSIMHVLRDSALDVHMPIITLYEEH